MTRLRHEIADLIRLEGPMSVARYMALCLGHPTLGYYITRDPIGAEGDFITAPEVSQMFGELIGLWAAETWRLMGAPDQLRLVELGPGRGTLMADALRAARILPGFLVAIRVDLVETSPVLRRRQSAALSAHEERIVWRDALEEVPDGPAIILANEFLDALPVRQYVRDGRRWRERLVGLDAEGGLRFGLSADPAVVAGPDAPEGAVLERAEAAAALMERLARRLVAQGGAALIIDYGHLASGYGDTLQAVRRHRPVDPLAEPGEADLTTHVDFAAMAGVAREAGAQVHGPTTQGAFLRALGIEQRAATLSRFADAAGRARIAAATRRLTGDGADDMGGLFKVLAVTAPGLTPPGFAG